MTGDPANQAEEAYVDQQDTEWADADEPNTVPSGDTVDADRTDAESQHHADRMPTPEEEAAAPTAADPKTATAYEEAIERGADVKGEGEI
jgi:hypothetical protein